MIAQKNIFSNLSNKDSTKLGIICSVILHLSVILFLSISFIFPNKNEPKERVYTVDILPVTNKTNIKSQTKEKFKEIIEEIEIEKAQPNDSPKEKPEEKELPKEKKEEPQEKVKEDPITPAKETEKTPEKKLEKPLESPIKKPEKAKKEEKKKEKKEKKADPKKEKNKKKDDDFDSLLKTLEKSTPPKKDKAKTDFASDKTAKGPYEDSSPLSISLEDDIRRQLEACWTPPSGVMDAGKLLTKLHITFQSDGTVTAVNVIQRPSSSNSRVANAAVDAAVRAVKKCSPLQNLPIDQYDSWKEINFNFDPSQMIY